MPADIWPAIGPGGEYDYRKLKTNANDELLAYIVNGLTGTFKPSGLNVGGLITHVPLTDGSWTAVPTSALADRNNIVVQNISGNGGVVLWNYSNTAPATEGFRIEDGGHKSVGITDDILVYCRMLSGTGEVCVDEVA